MHHGNVWNQPQVTTRRTAVFGTFNTNLSALGFFAVSVSNIHLQSCTKVCHDSCLFSSSYFCVALLSYSELLQHAEIDLLFIKQINYLIA